MLPEGEYLYRDLSSEFVDVEKLLDEIDQEDVSGYLSFEGDGEHGFALIDMGSVGRIKVMRNGHERIESGAAAIEDLLENGSYEVQVVDCNESGREIVNIKLENDEIKSDISTDDLDVASFLATNITDQENDCHIILVADGYSGVITMVDGIPTQAKFSTEGEILVGNDALERALEYIDGGEATIDIYDMSEDDEARDEARGEDVIGERMEDELEGISEEFEDKADDLLDDMGLGLGEEDGDGGDDDGLGDIIDDGDDDDVDGMFDDDGGERGDGNDDGAFEDDDEDLFDSIETDE